MSRGHLVIPAYRESVRWPEFGGRLLAEADRRAGAWTLQLVDDGSGTGEVAELAAWVERARRGRDWVRPLIARPVNEGKGAAIYSGWDAADPEAEWLGFCDADGSVDAVEFFRIADGLGTCGAGPDLVACSRVGAGARREGGTAGRAVLSRMFAAVAHAAAGAGTGDTQCGAKFVRAGIYRAVRPKLKVKRFAFDVELLARARRAGARIAEEPVAWTHRPGGSLRVGRDGARMLFDLAALAVRLRRGK